MLKIDILTLFPSMFSGFLNESIIKRAIASGSIKVNVINFRDYSPLNNKQVDDTPYGGGAGMVLRCEPIFLALDAIMDDDAYVILLSPDGQVFKESTAEKLKNYKHLILICGHYEGLDERIKTRVNEVISIGDYVLTGGELPAMVVTDAITRLLPSVISADSLSSESFNDNLLDYPTYTKPAEYRGLKVPDILLSGDHAKIASWRHNEQIKKTKELRPDLLGDENE